MLIAELQQNKGFIDCLKVEFKISLKDNFSILFFKV